MMLAGEIGTPFGGATANILTSRLEQTPKHASSYGTPQRSLWILAHDVRPAKNIVIPLPKSSSRDDQGDFTDSTVANTVLSDRLSTDVKNLTTKVQAVLKQRHVEQIPENLCAAIFANSFVIICLCLLVDRFSLSIAVVISPKNSFQQ